MGQPKVTVNQTNGNLGRTAPSEDGNTLMFVSAVAAGNIVLDTVMGPYIQLSDAEADGFTEANDTANNTLAWRHIKDFFDLANGSVGTKLWIVPVAKTVTQSAQLDKDGSYGGVYAQLNGQVRLVVSTRVPDGAYVPTHTDGIENDIITAIANAKALRTFEHSKQRPIEVIIEGRNINGTLSSLKDLRAADGPNASGVMLVIDQDATVAALHADFAKYARAGYAAGLNAGLPVQRDMGRVKNGNVTIIGQARLSNGTDIIDNLTDTTLDSLHDKGYVYLRKHINKPGYYYNRSNACTPLTDDYAFFTYSRVADKASRIAVDVYTNELVDDILLNADGTLPAPTIKDFQAKLETSINANMPGEISQVTVFCDPLQNVATTDSIEAELNLVPVGYGANITVNLAFKLSSN